MARNFIIFTQDPLKETNTEEQRSFLSALSRKVCKFFNKSDKLCFCPPLEWSVAELKKADKNGVRLSARISRYGP